MPEDLRVLHPIEFFGDFTENGRLKSTQVCATDTPIQNKVKRANLTRPEIVAIVMYTGTVSHSELNLYRSNVHSAKALSKKGVLSHMPPCTRE